MSNHFQDNDKIMDHFFNPRNLGTMKNPDAFGQVGNPRCGDIMHIYLKIDNDIIKDIKFQTYGCAVAIASTSILTEMVKGKTLSETQKISSQRIREALGKMPAYKQHCTVLAEQALKKAIEDYQKEKNA
ncbi:iron-sulfur cluster assembly scaffold protein [Patescibacteria group bacterium]|nr:iron-sulfur cluster assembly scaffold protein [Patescibacteria group bacterium]